MIANIKDSISSLFLNFRLSIESQRKAFPSAGLCLLLSLSILDRSALIGPLSGMPREISLPEEHDRLIERVQLISRQIEEKKPTKLL